LAEEVAAAVARVRERALLKPPGVAETIDWANALQALGADGLEPEAATRTLGSLLKEREDLERVRAAMPDIIGSAGS
nr:MoxR family ATPase [Gemmatimonadota bacterium]NIU78984.1 MoxR family ATPase [Gammaproteobacteria bacterium]NIX24588.1 MoxR family ATPase [Actinomycetota bacterium]